MLNVKLIILCFLVAINILYGCLIYDKTYLKIYKRSRINLGTILIILLVCYILVIGSSTYDKLDYEIYYNAYRYGKDSFEVGFNLLCKIGNEIGLSFDLFRSLLFASSILLMIIGLTKAKLNANVSIAVYSIISMTLDFIQIRNFLAFSIVIYSLQWLFDGTHFGKFKYIIGVVLATSIHTLSVVYLVCFLYGYKNQIYYRRKIIGYIFICSILFSAIMKINPVIIGLTAKYIFSFNEEKRLAYTATSLNWGFLLYWLPEVIFLIISVFMKRYVKKMKDSELIIMTDRLLWLNICISCLFPLCIININFFRIFRNFAVLNYGILPLLMRIPKAKKEFWLIALYFVNLVLMFWINYGADFEDTFLVFFTNR